MVFGLFVDKIGRTRSLVLIVLLFSAATASSAAAPNLWIFFLCRLLAAAGSGGDFAAGAALVAEVVPEKRRVELGAILFTGILPLSARVRSAYVCAVRRCIFWCWACLVGES